MLLPNAMFLLYLNTLFEKNAADGKANPPTFRLSLQPAIPTSKYPPIFVREADVKGQDYKEMHRSMTAAFYKIFAPSFDAWRAQLGLSPMSLDDCVDVWKKGPWLLGFSSHLCEFPDDWPRDIIHSTGFWTLSHNHRAEWSPPDELVAYLERLGEQKPVYIGFGSMHYDEPDKFTKMILDAIKLSGCPTIISQGWGTLKKPENWDASEFDDKVIFVDDIDHTWLLPKCSIGIIHGGAGTTSSVMRAGIPAIVLPFFADQPFWGDRVADKGCGPSPTSALKITSEELAEKITSALADTAMQQKAAEMGEKLRTENGVMNAVKIITAALPPK